MKQTTGLDNLLLNPDRTIKGKALGLVVNHTSLAADRRHSIVHFHQHPQYHLKKIFAPEHGLYGVEQDMASVADATDPVTGLPVLSLYGKGEDTLSPPPGLLADLDTLIFDIQDIGARYYTFIYTLANCMRVCRDAGVRLVVCDRPNPINGTHVEGNLVADTCRSFVGQYPLPNRHGMTIGELAMMFNDHFGLHCDLRVVPVSGWDRHQWYDQTSLLWVAPSPNMPRLETAAVYPGMCLLEGTQLSEGRGTALPFEQCGAPYIEPQKLVAELERDKLPGVHFRPHYFQPTFQKWAGQPCGGVQLHVTDRDIFKPVLSGVAIIRAIARLYPEQFQWRTEPYEFVSDRPAIDLLYGNTQLREQLIESNAPLSAIESAWQEDLNEFHKLRQNYLLYPSHGGGI